MAERLAAALNEAAALRDRLAAMAATAEEDGSGLPTMIRSETSKAVDADAEPRAGAGHAREDALAAVSN